MHKASKGSLLALAGIVGLWIAANLALSASFSEEEIYGDETAYAKHAWRSAHQGWTSLIPGNLSLTHHPSFHGHVLSQLGPEATEDEGRLRAKQRPPKEYGITLVRRATLLNIGLVSLVVVALYVQGLLLGLGPALSLLPGLLLCCLPRLVFHVHAIWSETLHLFFETMFLTCVVVAYRMRRLWLLVPAGLCLGYAILTRSTLLFFAPVAAGMTALVFVRRNTGPVHARLKRALAATATLSVFASLVVVPQLVANRGNGNGLRLATNTWRNVEYGLRRPAPGDDPQVRSVDWRAATKQYRRPGPPKLHPVKPINRELHSRRRTFEFVASLPVSRHIVRQWRKLWMLLGGNPMLAHAVRAERWGPASARLEPWVALDATYWRGLVILGLVGAALSSRQSAGHSLIATFVGYYLLALFVASINVRVALQLVPALCLSVGSLIAFAAQTMRNWWRTARV